MAATEPFAKRQHVEAVLQSKINNLLAKAKEEAKKARALADARLSDIADAKEPTHWLSMRYHVAEEAKVAAEKHLEQAELYAANYFVGKKSVVNTGI